MEETHDEILKRQKEESKKKRCPFDKMLECEDCRLNQTYAGGRGDKCCVFVRMT